MVVRMRGLAIRSGGVEVVGSWKRERRVVCADAGCGERDYADISAGLAADAGCAVSQRRSCF